MTPVAPDALCHLCPRYGQPFALSVGNLAEARIVWLDDEPSLKQVHGGPLSGAAPTRLRGLVEAAAALLNKTLDPDDIAVLLATLCKAPSREPETTARRAITCCRPRLLNELRQVKAAHLLVLGPRSWYAVTGSAAGFGDACGFHHALDLAELATLASRAVEKLEAKASKR